MSVKDFVARNTRVIPKIVVNQLALIIFGFAVTFAVSENGTMVMLVSVFAVLFYSFLTYNTMWEFGALASVRREKPDPRTATIGAIVLETYANLLNIAAAAVYSVCYIYVYATQILDKTMAAIGYVAGLISRVLFAMFLGIESTLFPNPHVNLNTEEAAVLTGIEAVLPVAPWFYIAAAVGIMAIGTAGFYCGFTERSLLAKLGFKTKRKIHEDMRYR